MLNEKIEKALNDQIQKEDYSSQLYLSMASWAENQGLSGIAEWLYAQSEEERMHMLKFVHYVNDRGGKAVIPAMEKPPVQFESIPNMFAEVLKHEQYISQSINDIVGLCIEEKDFTTHNWIQWFVEEQIEEESSAQEIVDKIEMIGTDGKHLYMFDRDIMKLRAAGEAN